MLDLGLPGYSRDTSRATSRVTSRANSPRSVRSDETDSSMFSEMSYDSSISTHFDTRRLRSRPTSLTMNYQPRKSAKINETTSQRKANNTNKVVMRSINTPTHTHSERYRNLMKSRDRYSDLMKSGSIAKSRLQPPEIKDPVRFTNNPKNKNYTMERMPILDEAKGGFTFDPKLPDDYLKKINTSTTVKNNTSLSVSNNKDYPNKDIKVIDKPDRVQNTPEPKPEPWVPSWLRKE